MNWGWKIVVTFVFFFIIMGTLVYKSAIEDHQLVTENYYEKEMAYQEVIDQQKNAREVGLRWEELGEGICLQVPAQLEGMEGEVRLYRASNSSLDKLYTFDAEKPCFESAAFEKGKWKISFTGSSDGQTYFVEQVWVIG
jgi:hypothetical protein